MIIYRTSGSQKALQLVWLSWETFRFHCSRCTEETFRCFRCSSPLGVWTLCIMNLLVRNVYIWWSFIVFWPSGPPYFTVQRHLNVFGSLFQAVCSTSTHYLARWIIDVAWLQSPRPYRSDPRGEITWRVLPRFSRSEVWIPQVWVSQVGFSETSHAVFFSNRR